MFLNLAFDLSPHGEDIRGRIATGLKIDVSAEELVVLRELSKREARLVRGAIEDAQVEVWARLTAPRKNRG